MENMTYGHFENVYFMLPLASYMFGLLELRKLSYKWTSLFLTTQAGQVETEQLTCAIKRKTITNVFASLMAMEAKLIEWNLRDNSTK